MTARYNEGFHRFFLRVLLACPASAWAAEREKLQTTIDKLHAQLITAAPGAGGGKPWWKFW